MATINITSFCIVVASMIARRADGITAAKSTTYGDSDCTELISYGYTFKGAFVSTGSTTSFGGDFNECSTYGNTTTFSTVCDSSTGEYRLEYYSDTECADLLYENDLSQDCSSEYFITTSSDPQQFLTIECSDEEPSVISPNTVNYLAEEYNDDGCTDPTGNTEILSFGYDGTCAQDELLSSTWSFMECMADGSVISQYFALDDDTCSGDLWGEVQIIFGTSLALCTPFESNGLYYNPISCTTDSATLSSADNTGEAASGATRAKSTGVAAGTVAIICGLWLVVGRMRQ